MAQENFVTTPHNSGLGNPLATAFEMQQDMNTELYDIKVNQVPGKGLSDVNFSAADKAKLDSITTPISPQVQTDYDETNPASLSFLLNKKTKTSDFVNDGDGSNPFVADVDIAGVFGRSDGGWVVLSDIIFPKIQITATAGQTVFPLGTGALARAVFWNGALLNDADWSQTGTNITTTFPFNLGDLFKPI